MNDGLREILHDAIDTETRLRLSQDPDDADDGCARVVVPDDAAPTPCRVCGEAFDVAWDATAGEWVLAAAVSVPVDDGTDAVVHRACRDAVCGRGGTLEAAALVPVPSPPPGPTAP